MPWNHELAAWFARQFGTAARAISFAPGRVNLIGEHTDYNDGLALPMAIQFGVYGAGRLTGTGRVRALSRNFPDEPLDFSVDEEPGTDGWGRYLRAVLAELRARGLAPTGLDLCFWGDVPPEAGLSSSAAFSVSAVLLVGALLGHAWDDPATLARIAQAAEHRTGVQCGLLDQMASAACTAGSAMRLDCRDLSRTMIPLDRQRLAVIVGDTRVRRSLGDGRYNQRRAECEAAARACGVRSLRDLSLAELERHRGRLPDALYRRARHILTENERVDEFAAALRAGDFPRVGAVANAGHASLRDDLEVTCPELNAMAAAFVRAGAYGARMVGGGFGGSAIALVDPAQAEPIITKAAADYHHSTGLTAAFHVVVAGDGARIE